MLVALASSAHKSCQLSLGLPPHLEAEAVEAGVKERLSLGTDVLEAYAAHRPRLHLAHRNAAGGQLLPRFAAKWRRGPEIRSTASPRAQTAMRVMLQCCAVIMA